MLCELIIENVAVIQKANIKLSNGFTCLTGETGAGKSIIIDSINAISGDRISKNIIRTGADKAIITAVFDDVLDTVIYKAKEMFDIDISQECIVTRQINKDGKSSARINSMPVPISVLKELFTDLITIHGQHDNQSLLNSSKHIEILDSFSDDTDKFKIYKDYYNEYIKLNKQIIALQDIDKTKAESIELLSYQIDEIENANISIEEEEELLNRKQLIKSSEKIITCVNNAYYLFSGDDEVQGIYQSIQKAENEISQVSEYSDILEEAYGKITQANELAQDAVFQLKNFIDDFDVDVNEIDDIEERLDLYYKLKRKYGNNVSDILEFYDKAVGELNSINFAQENLDDLLAQREKLMPKLKKSAEKLTNLRLESFKKLSSQIKDALSFLNMPYAELFLEHEIKDFSSNGQDSIEFLIVTNKGDTKKPLSKIASGGELSRIMLAIKRVLAQKDKTYTLIFDEVDTGVSGSAAAKIGKLLKQTSKGKQVLCVTHSAQIAAFAHTHLYIEKESLADGTYTSVRELQIQERVNEIARIISGDNISKTALLNAKEMLELAKN